MSNPDTPADTCRKKLDALEQARRRYIQMLYGYLPCLDMPDEAPVAHGVINLIHHIAQLHECLHGGKPKAYTPEQAKADYEAMFAQPQQPVQQASSSEAEGIPLTEQEQAELRGLIQVHQIYVARDPDTQELTMTHPFITGAFHPLNGREVLEVARDIAEKAGGIS